MTVARNVAEALEKHVTLEVEFIDRLHLNLYQPVPQTPGGAAHFFRNILPQSGAFLGPDGTESVDFEPFPRVR